MNKKKIIGIVVIVIVLLVLICFASFYQLSDSHLRSEGIRVRVNEGALVVDGRDEANAIYCKKVMNVGDEEAVLEFKFLNFKENGYPGSMEASINGHSFYKEDGLNIEENGSLDYKIFLNFHVMDDLIMFTFTDGTAGRTTTLYAIDLEGNIILEENEMDEDDMLIKDYTDFITYKDNVVTIYATRVVEDINYKGVSVCKAPHEDILEAYYTYTYEDGEFTKELIDEIDSDEFIENVGIKCASRE